MSEQTISRLRAAMGTGEVLRVRYHGGSKPGSTRDLIPVQIEGTSKVRCRCYTSGAVKQFNIEKIEILPLEPASFASEWTPEPAHPAFSRLCDVLTKYHEDLESKGWAVEIMDDENGESLLLFKRFKNGKLRKNPSVIFSYEHTAYDIVAMPDGTIGKANPRPRARPWSVRGGETTNTWGSLSRALPTFLIAAGIAPG